MAYFVFFMAALLAPQPASPQSAAPALDYAFFKARVQPIFLNKRKGNARCVACHQREARGGFRLQPLLPGRTDYTEEQSRMNFDGAKVMVVPGNVSKSRLAVHPLADEAGGDGMHSGGKHWFSKDSPEWKNLAAWIEGATL